MDMPEDVILEILLWLPVISLLRFKSVCKSWRSLIQSPEFIHLHQEQPKLNPNGNIIILNAYKSRSPRSTLSLSLLSGNNFENFQNIDLPFKFEQELLDADIKATCNGVICLKVKTVVKSSLYRFYTNLFLWNPATKQVSVVSKSELVDYDRYKDLGFGYDVKTNDYKVVKFFIENSDNCKDNCRICVYSLRTNSWTTTKADIPIRFVSSDPVAPYRNRIYCWLGTYIFKENGYLKYSYSILAFDFSKEAFECIPLPEIYSSDPSCNLKLVLLGEKIGCIDSQSRFSKRGDWHCQIWILNEYGVKESWTKIYTLRLETEAYTLGATLDGKIMWQKSAEKKDTGSWISELHLCDPVTQKLTMLPIETLSWRFSVAVFKESLVSLL